MHKFHYVAGFSGLLGLVLAGLLAGCGQKGPLEFTPEQEARVEQRDEARRRRQLAEEAAAATDDNDQASETDEADAQQPR